jgi:hypothetical protein
MIMSSQALADFILSNRHSFLVIRFSAVTMSFIFNELDRILEFDSCSNTITINSYSNNHSNDFDSVSNSPRNLCTMSVESNISVAPSPSFDSEHPFPPFSPSSLPISYPYFHSPPGAVPSSCSLLLPSSSSSQPAPYSFPSISIPSLPAHAPLSFSPSVSSLQNPSSSSNSSFSSSSSSSSSSTSASSSLSSFPRMSRKRPAPPVESRDEDFIEQHEYYRVFLTHKSKNWCYVLWYDGSILENEITDEIKNSVAYQEALHERNSKQIRSWDLNGNWKTNNPIIGIYFWRIDGTLLKGQNILFGCAHEHGNFSELPLKSIPEEWKQRLKIRNFSQADYLPQLRTNRGMRGCNGTLCMDCFILLDSLLSREHHACCFPLIR